MYKNNNTNLVSYGSICISILNSNVAFYFKHTFQLVVVTKNVMIIICDYHLILFSSEQCMMHYAFHLNRKNNLQTINCKNGFLRKRYFDLWHSIIPLHRVENKTILRLNSLYSLFKRCPVAQDFSLYF